LNDIKEICKTIACRLESILHQAGQISGDVDVKWRIKEFFSKNFLKAPTLNDLSKYIWLSNSRTSHILKRHFDKTFPELINCYKLDRAKNLLAYTSFSVSEIAWQSGFKDPEYLHRIFKKSEGMTPCEYRHSVELIKANPNGI
jgi:YesN/AraC family two-component response regulator